MLEIPEGPFEAYLFDCDGTLADSMPIHYEAWKYAVRECGVELEISREYYYALGGVPTHRFGEVIEKDFGVRLDVERLTEAKREFYEENLDRVRPVGPVVEFALSLPPEKVAVVSGGVRQMLMKTLRAIRVDHHFRVIVAGEDTERGKPHPDPFLLAAQQLEVEPERCLVLEDSPTGERAATAAGMACVRVDAERYRLRDGAFS